MPVAGILLTLLHAAAAVGAAPPVDRPALRVLVHADGALATDRRMLGEVVRRAHDIWTPYADVTFDLAADAVRSSRSLDVVITDRLSTISDGASLGWIEFIDGRPSNVITVSTAAAMQLLKRSRWAQMPKIVQSTFLVKALSSAMAHELGHYLLASREHVRKGLMRGSLTADEIMQPLKWSYRLDRGQVSKLQQGALLARRDNAPPGGIQN